MRIRCRTVGILRAPKAVSVVFIMGLIGAFLAYHTAAAPVALLRGQSPDPVYTLILDQGFRAVDDAETGVRLQIPFGLLVPAKKGNWGSNWLSQDQRLHVATLNFRGERTLKQVYEKLKARDGRRITKDDLSADMFTLRGEDRDGSAFYVQAEDLRGEVRGISITFERKDEAKFATVVQTIIGSFQAFPEAPPTASDPSLSTPTSSNAEAKCRALHQKALSGGWFTSKEASIFFDLDGKQESLQSRQACKDFFELQTTCQEVYWAEGGPGIKSSLTTLKTIEATPGCKGILGAEFVCKHLVAVARAGKPLSGTLKAILPDCLNQSITENSSSLLRQGE